MKTGFKELEVWQLAQQLVKDIYAASASFPEAEQFGLTTQIRRAAVSVPCNIAEGWGRNADGSFVHYLRIARGSLNEVETLLTIATDLSLISEEDHDRMTLAVSILGRKLYNLIERVKAQAVRDESEVYSASRPS